MLKPIVTAMLAHLGKPRANAARRYERVRLLCPEDLINLETKLGQWLTSSGE